MKDKWGVIVNPHSGNKKVPKRWNTISRLLRELDTETRFTIAPAHAIELAKKFVENGYRKIIVIGGDGTFNEVVNGIYWGGNIDVISKLLSISIMSPENIRFFLGYSGWTGGQLDEELKKDSWLVGDIRPSRIIHPSRNLWKESVRNVGDQYQLWTTFPENPGYN